MAGLYAEILQGGGGGGRRTCWVFKKKRGGQLQQRQGEHWKTMLKKLVW